MEYWRTYKTQNSPIDVENNKITLDIPNNIQSPLIWNFLSMITEAESSRNRNGK
jgi:hypothetical protein